MRIIVEIDDNNIKNDIINTMHKEVDKVVKDILTKIDFEYVINDRIKYHVDKSQQLTERTLRNYVQQKIAKELANTIFKDKED